MVKLVDAVDSKSTGSDTVPVRVRPRAPLLSKRRVPQGTFFVFKGEKGGENRILGKNAIKRQKRYKKWKNWSCYL